MKRSLLSLLLFTSAACALPGEVRAQSSSEAGMLRFPDVSATNIVFVFANDLWIVPRSGGVATPLASPAGSERSPSFSADGSTIAFIGNYEGDSDLYTVPVAGGVPYRVTHQPGTEGLSEWTSDGRLIFSSSATAGIRRAPMMFSVSANGGLPVQLPIPYGQNGTISADGRTLAYTPNARDNRNWKRYRGGMASDIWMIDLQALTSTRVTDWEGTDTIPMWHGDKLYYMSDHGPEQRLNIWVYDPASSAHRQVTSFTDYDVKWPSIGPGDAGQGEIVFQNNLGLMLLDLGTEKARMVEVSVPGARESIRPRSVDVSGAIVAADISRTGKRVVVEARGDIWTLPAEKGTPRNLTRTAGVAERDPSWSPDGRWVAYFSDATGEYELYLTQSDGRGETRQLTEGGEGYRYGPTWAPTSDKIAFSDRSGSIYVHDIDARETTFVERHEMAEWGVDVNWSHDGRWLTYSSIGEVASSASIKLYDTTNAELHQVTSDMFNDGSPVFDRKGDYLYFESGRNFQGQVASAIDSSYVHRDTGVLLAVPLRADVEYPWAPESDEECWDGEDEDDGADADADDEDEDEDEDEDHSVDAEDDGVSGQWKGTLTIPGAGEVSFKLTLRLLPGGILEGEISSALGSGTFGGDYDAESGEVSGDVETDEGLTLSFEGTLADESVSLTFETPNGEATMEGTRTSASAGDDEDENSDDDDKPAEVVEIEIEGFERRAIQLPVAPGSFGDLAVNHKNQLLYARRGDDAGIKLFDIFGDDLDEEDVTSGRGFGLSADGKKLMVMRAGTPAIGKAGAGSKPKKVSTDGMTALIDPRKEWPQIYTDAWRLFRDYFYAANMHGVDWKAVYDQYRPMIDACATRNDVDYVLRETVAELNCGHTYIRGGPFERGPRVGVGLLGCDYTLENGAYRISKIIEGGVWDSDARGPLSQPGVDVAEGDYLLAVNGISMDASLDPWAAFVGLAGKALELTVSQKPSMDDDSRRVRVKAMSSEGSLRYRAWIEATRAHVFEKSGGKVGYVYVPDTGQNGRNNFFRQIYGQSHLAALIVDERWNGGGQFPSREIEALNRPRSNYWARRWGRSWETPSDSHQGPKCMLINRDSGSGGDMFPYLFKQAGIGKLIGTRTWGGLVGYSGSPSLIDGATLSIPSFGFYELDGTWGVEGHGVDPDIEVMDDPALMQNGADPQVDAAIELMLSELETKAYNPPARPADPDRSGMGLPESERNSFPMND